MQSNTLSSDSTYVIHPKKFVLWLLIVASVMLFAGFTSAYIVRRGEGNWEVFNLPSLFQLNTLFIVLSSVALQLAFSAVTKGNVSRMRALLLTTLLLGVAFCFGQWYAWKQLVADNVFFAFSNPSNSFVYVISGVHLFHVVGGLIFLLALWIQSFQGKISQDRTIYLSMGVTYWHFIGILWIYLYVFLSLYR